MPVAPYPSKAAPDAPDATCASVSVAGATAARPAPRWKRAFDVSAATGALIFLAPALAAIALYVKVVSRGPVLFFQRRIGAQGRPFWIWKFRTMRTGANQSRHADYIAALSRDGGTPAKLDVTSDLIPGGAWLRQWSLDELPQLINVLRGEMSIVGPRPDVLDAEHYELWAQARFQVLPGLTGLWQVSGKNQSSWDEMLRLDVHYATACSPALDARILLRTIPVLLGGNTA